MQITNPDKISYAANKYANEHKNVNLKRIAKYIEEQILCTPWNLSQSFV